MIQLLSFLLSSLFFFVICLLHWRGKLHRKNKDVPDLPPGSMGWPLIGETLEFLEPQSATSKGTFMERHCQRYGTVFKSSLFGQPTVISADPELNRFILQNEDKLFQCSYPSTISGILGKWSMLVLVGDAHKRMRTIALAFMNSAKLKDFFLQDVEKHVLLALDAWSHGSHIVHAQEEAKKFAFNLVAKQILSFNPGEARTIALMKDYYTFMKGVIAVPINLPGTAYNKAMKSRARILATLQKELVKRKQLMAAGGALAMEYNDLLGTVTCEGSLTTEQILDLLLNMLFGGHETSSVALTLAIKFLAESPKAMEELRFEHLEIRSLKKPDEVLNWDDYKSMRFTQCVINETLRLGNVVRFVHRKALRDVYFRNYRIPKGWKVLPVFSAVHLDPSVYSNALAFDPWRWNQMMTRNSYFTPFGGGTRLCAGADLAKLEIAIFLHHLTLNFQWQLGEPDRALAFPFVEFEKGLPIQLSRKPAWV